MHPATTPHLHRSGDPDPDRYANDAIGDDRPQHSVRGRSHVLDHRYRNRASRYSMRTPYSANPVSLAPIDADPLASYIFMSPKGDCSGRYTCTFVTTASGMKSGWYTAGHAGSPGLAGTDICPPSLNLVYGCTTALSESAVYIPQATDKEPPQVHMVATGSGLTTKAIAIAQDRYGESMALTWDFGDGSPPATGSFGSVVSHTYANVGEYAVIARVRTADGRNGSDTADAGVGPPKPKLLALGRVAAPNGGVPAVATALVQGWPNGAVANVLTWDSGCPADPTSAPALNSAVYSGYVAVAADGTIDIALAYIDPAATPLWSRSRGASTSTVVPYMSSGRAIASLHSARQPRPQHPRR